MSTSVRIIKFIVILCIVTLILTYIVSLNIENIFFNLNTIWLSNNFLFTILSGAFASLIVIIICEIQKYIFLKRETENMIFSQLLALYTQITIIYYNANRTLNDSKNPVAANLFDSPSNIGKSILKNIEPIDYTPFLINSIAKYLCKFKNNDCLKIDAFLNNLLFYKMALSYDKIELIKKNLPEVVTSNLQSTHDVLKKIQQDSNAILTYLEKIMEAFDLGCNNRFNWKNVKKTIIRYEEEHILPNLCDYIQQPTVQIE